MKRLVVSIALFAAMSIQTELLAAPDCGNCASAITIASNSSYVSDTTNTTNWMTSFGPLVSPSHDNLYTFTAGLPIAGIVPTASSYQFAMYLIASCSDSGTEPAPIRATATIGTAIFVGDLPQGQVYYIAVTGTAAGGGGANGTLSFNDGFPVTLQTFTVD